MAIMKSEVSTASEEYRSGRESGFAVAAQQAVARQGREFQLQAVASS